MEHVYSLEDVDIITYISSIQSVSILCYSFFCINKKPDIADKFFLMRNEAWLNLMDQAKENNSVSHILYCICKVLRNISEDNTNRIKAALNAIEDQIKNKDYKLNYIEYSYIDQLINTMSYKGATLIQGTDDIISIANRIKKYEYTDKPEIIDICKSLDRVARKKVQEAQRATNIPEQTTTKQHALMCWDFAIFMYMEQNEN